jgi:hypothetical protein
MNGLCWQALVRWRTSGLEYPALFIKLNSLSRLAAPLLLNTQGLGNQPFTLHTMSHAKGVKNEQSA